MEVAVRLGEEQPRSLQLRVLEEQWLMQKINIACGYLQEPSPKTTKTQLLLEKDVPDVYNRFRQFKLDMNPKRRDDSISSPNIGVGGLPSDIKRLAPTRGSFSETPGTPSFSQTISASRILRLGEDDPPIHSHDGDPSQFHQSQSRVPPALSDPGVELDNFPTRETEESPPSDDEFEDSTTLQTREESHRIKVPDYLCGIAIFLAPVNIVLGMAARNGDNWKVAFMGFFVAWLVVCTSWLFLDLRGLQRSSGTKRVLWHLGGCAASIYFYASVLQIKPDNLPQWLPTIIDCGLGVSLGFQNIPANARNGVGGVLSGIIGMISGGTQVIIGRDEQQTLQRDVPLSLRGRQTDLETGLMA